MKASPLCVPQRTCISSLKVNPDDVLLFESYVNLLLVCVSCVLADKGLQGAGRFCIAHPLRPIMSHTLLTTNSLYTIQYLVDIFSKGLF